VKSDLFLTARSLAELAPWGHCDDPESGLRFSSNSLARRIRSFRSRVTKTRRAVATTTLSGGPGSDGLDGGGGSDTFVYARGDGLDRIGDGGGFETDRVRLTDVAPGEAQLERRSNSLHLTIVVNRGADEIQLLDFYGGASHAYGVEELEFSDGTVWNRAYLLAHASQVGG
jgi:hypothetical protein